MTKKVDEALATLSRVVPTRFSGDVAVIKAEIKRLLADQERLIAELKKADQHSEELERKYMAAKWPEVEARMKKYADKIRRERNGGNL